MSKLFSLCVVAALLSGVFGCAQLDDDPPKGGKNKSAAVRRSDSGARKKRRDPVDDMFLGVGKRAEAPTFAEGLDPDEKEMLEKELRRQDDEMKELRRRHRDSFDSARDKRQEWVFGVSPRKLK